MPGRKHHPPPRKFSLTHKWKPFCVCKITLHLKMVLGKGRNKGFYLWLLYTMKGSYMRVIRGAIRKGLKKYLWRFFSVEVCDQVFHERRSANREMEKYLCGHFVQAARNGRLTETEIFIKNFFPLRPLPLKPQLSCCGFREWHHLSCFPVFVLFAANIFCLFLPRHNSFLQLRQNL